MMQHEKNIQEKLFDREFFRPFTLLDRIDKIAGLIWVYQAMEIELEEFKKKYPDHPKIKDAQDKIDVLTQFYVWVTRQYHNAEILQKVSLEWQIMCLKLTKDNDELMKENIKLKKMLDAE